MTDYNGLKPGVYLQHGDKIVKTAGKEYIGSFNDLLFGSGGQRSVERLASSVGWVWSAIKERKQQILEIPQEWHQNENVIDFVPFGAKWMELEQRIDESLQYYSVAYALKQRQGRRVVGVRWLDPTAVTPDENSKNTVTEDYDYYFYHVGDGQRQRIARADMFVWKIPGMRELEPGTSAAVATKLAASILHGISQTANTFYGNNALPVMLIIVPDHTAPQEKERLQDRFKALFNQGEGTLKNRTVAVSQSVEVRPISLAPKDLAQKDLEDSEVDLILAAHSVPKSIVLANAANYATDIAARRAFVSTMGGRLSFIAEVINTDPDMMALGLSLVVMVENHYAMQQDEKERAGAILNYTQAGFTTAAAAWLFGIRADDFPPEMEVFQSMAQPDPVVIEQPQPEPLQLMEPTEDDAMKSAERRQFRAWYKKRGIGTDAAKFTAHHITEDDKLEIVTELCGDLWGEY